MFLYLNVLFYSWLLNVIKGVNLRINVRKKHIADFKELFPAAQVRLVDGEMFSWYGSRLLKAGNYFSSEFLSFDKQ